MSGYIDWYKVPKNTKVLVSDTDKDCTNGKEN